MKLLAGMLAFAALAGAADKRYVVCLVTGTVEQCTKPLTKEVAQAVYQVFIMTPISGLDYVFLGDVKGLKKQKPAGVKREPSEPQVPIPPTGTITLT